MNRENAFILSSWRAGSTLLQRLLNAHSRIVGLHEMHFPFLELPPERRRWWNTDARRVVRLSLDAIKACGVEAGWRELLARDPVRTRATFDRISLAIRVAHKKTLFVDKTPNYSLEPRLLDRLFPEGVLRILLVRAPGGVAASCRETFPEVFASIEAGLDHWLRYYASLRAYSAQAQSQTQSGAIHSVAYEDLVCDGPATLEPLCRYLGVAFEPSMLEYSARGSASTLTGRRDFGDPSLKLRSGKIDADNAERWTAAHGDSVRRWLERTPEARALAREFGYDGELANERRRTPVKA